MQNFQRAGTERRQDCRGQMGRKEKERKMTI